MTHLTLVQDRGTEGIEPAAELASLRFVVVTEDPLLRKGLRLLLEADGLRAYEVESIARGRRMCSSGTGCSREVILWVVDELDTEVGTQAREVLSSDGPGMCILARDVHVETARELVGQDARGFGIVVRGPDTEPGAVIRCLWQVAAGDVSLEPGLVRRILRDAPHPEGELTPMEQSVLELVAAGWRNREIALRLHRSEKSVENHIGRIFAKLGLDWKLQPEIDRRVTAAMLYGASRRVALAVHARAPAPVSGVKP